MGISDKIIQFTLSKKDYPTQVGHIVNLSLLDWLSVSLAGQNEPVSQVVRSCFIEEGGNSEAFVFGSDQKISSRSAALINGTISHALDYDDTHFASLGHPSVTVMPASLALADRLGSDLNNFKRAILCGMEIAIRVGVWLGRSHYRKGFHITSTAGTFGATTASAYLLGLNRNQFKMALGLAASRASGIKSQFGTMGKPFHAGIAASNGVESALLALKGFVATEEPFEGPQSFAATHDSENNSEIFNSLGTEFIFEAVTHKFHACCHGLHAGMEALIELRENHSLSPCEIKEISLIIHPQYLNVCNILSPRTGLEAKFSFRLTAAMIMWGVDTARLESFSNSVCSNASFIELRDKVFIETNGDLNETAASAKITMLDGRVFTAKHDLSTLADPSLREKKVRSKSNSLIGQERSEKIWQAITEEITHVEIPISKLLLDF